MAHLKRHPSRVRYLLGRTGSQLEVHSVSVVRVRPKVSGVNDDLWGPNRSLKSAQRWFNLRLRIVRKRIGSYLRANSC